MGEMNRPVPPAQRRRFLRDLIPRAARYCSDLGDELQGRPQLLLDDLPRWPDAGLREIVPVFAPGLEVVFDAAGLRLRGGERGEIEITLPLDAVQRAVLQRFGSGASLGEIADRVAADGLPCDFGAVKALFLTLARRAVCHPAQPLTCEPGPEG